MSLDDQETVTFKMDKAEACALSKAAFKLDKNKSEVIRACIKGYLPVLMKKLLIEKFPELCAILNGEER